MRAQSIVCAFLLVAAVPIAALDAKPRAKVDAGGGIAVGLFLGQPTGLTSRVGLGASNSLEVKAAWDLTGSKAERAAFLFQANWLLEFPGVLGIEGKDIPPYVGAGVELDVGSEYLIGLRIPAGLIWRFERAPIELCVEIGLGMGLFPSTKVLASGGFGVRYILRPTAR